MTGKQTWVLGLTSLASLTLGEHMVNPNLTHQMARDRRADLLREAKKYRRAGRTARRTILIRMIVRIPHFSSGSRCRRALVAVRSTGEPPDPSGAA